MLKNVEEKAGAGSGAAHVRKTSGPPWQARRLSALEIAEGALLADIGVIFQLLIRYLPVGGSILQLLVPVIFAMLVLRRGLYVACMSLCVALFLICLVMGPGGMPYLLLEIGAGLFLGVTMRYRLPHLLIIVLGVFGGALGLWAVVITYSFLAGGPASLIRGMHQTYVTLTPLVGAFFRLLALGNWWQNTLLPQLNRFIQWALQNWWLLLYLAACFLCIPVVIGVYLVTNLCLRLLGYPVPAFPGYRLEGLSVRLLRLFLKLFPARTLARSSRLHRLQRTVRFLNRARLRQQRLEQEGRSQV